MNGTRIRVHTRHLVRIQYQRGGSEALNVRKIVSVILTA